MNEKKIKFGGTSPLSWTLFKNMQIIYFTELQKGLTGNQSRNGFHIYSPQCLTAFPLAIATWEALLNEEFTSDWTYLHYKENLLFKIIEEADKWSVETKTLKFPLFLFGKTFDTSSNNFGNLKSIIKIRNSITHYKHSFYEGPDKVLEQLRQIKVSYPKSDNSGCAWHMELSSTECVRFCVNTISKLVIDLDKLETKFYKNMSPSFKTDVFSQITEKDVINEFKKLGIDHNSVNNDIFQQS